MGARQSPVQPLEATPRVPNLEAGSYALCCFAVNEYAFIEHQEFVSFSKSVFTSVNETIFHNEVKGFDILQYMPIEIPAGFRALVKAFSRPQGQGRDGLSFVPLSQFLLYPYKSFVYAIARIKLYVEFLKKLFYSLPF